MALGVCELVILGDSGADVGGDGKNKRANEKKKFGKLGKFWRRASPICVSPDFPLPALGFPMLNYLHLLIMLVRTQLFLALYYFFKRNNI